MIASPETLRALEWPALLALVADEARTDLGTRRLLELLPVTDRDELEARRAAFEEVGRLGVDGALVPSTGAPLAPLVERLASGRPPLDGSEILGLAGMLAAAGEALDRIRAADPPCLELSRRVEGIADPAPLVRRIRRVLDAKGRVRDDASPRLTALAREIRGTRERIYGRLEQLR
ncbi:MAG TPA: hypothetical protein VLA66_03890, partial [Thermoanaerobaculia bacterium]|nr:hypothetical protein [Thermoanaerobaculia bacterium]